jgi:hypothetical protein
LWRVPRCQSRRQGDLHRDKRRLSIPAQPILARQPAPREQLARRQPVTPSRHGHQSWAAIALGNDPLLFFQCPTASSARRDNFQSGELRIRRMVSHTPMSSPSIAPRKAALAGAILSTCALGPRTIRKPSPTGGIGGPCHSVRIGNGPISSMTNAQMTMSQTGRSEPIGLVRPLCPRTRTSLDAVGTSLLCRQQTSFDSVGAYAERRRNGQSQRSCSFHVDSEIKARGALEW